MNANEVFEQAPLTVEDVPDGAALLSPLLRGWRPPLHEPRLPAHEGGVRVGELLAITDDGTTPLVRWEGQPDAAAVRARATVELHAAHIGSRVVLVFERGDPALPIVTGVLRGQVGWPVADRPAQVEVDADGQRLTVTARDRLVLRCGKASITLTGAGKILIEGTYLSSRSTGVNRIKGGSVQLN